MGNIQVIKVGTCERDRKQWYVWSTETIRQANMREMRQVHLRSKESKWDRKRTITSETHIDENEEEMERWNQQETMETRIKQKNRALKCNLYILRTPPDAAWTMVTRGQ